MPRQFDFTPNLALLIPQESSAILQICNVLMTKSCTKHDTAVRTMSHIIMVYNQIVFPKSSCQFN
jgi:hypothetical protein